MAYGKEIILDLHNCNVSRFNRVDIRNFCKLLCKEIGMKRSRLFWWDYFNEDALQKYRELESREMI